MLITPRWLMLKSGKNQLIYSPFLVEAVNRFDQEIYRVKLPGPPNIGEGKPENQNHVMSFGLLYKGSRGEAEKADKKADENDEGQPLPGTARHREFYPEGVAKVLQR
ncbi:callose synthase 5-like [Lactuca sativa]|uniref:callose synthase 5-like n=1 Tax=Lactuca sativa TaxID=4236 RepID=UPI0022AF1642|nr:callose synthase 5-like [Lactuca sativa]